MNDVSKIASILEERGVAVAGSVVSNPSVASSFFVPVRLKRSVSGAKTPSGRTLSLAQNDLREVGLIVDFILIDEESKETEESLRASLISSFPGDVRNSFLSLEGKSPQLWIEFKKAPNSDTITRIEHHLRTFEELFSLPTIKMTSAGEVNTPTRTELLSLIRQFAPIDTATLEKKLKEREFYVPSTSWVNHRLDALRKINFIMRQSDGTYLLTREALGLLGTKKGRSSPDLKRLLALARGNL